MSESISVKLHAYDTVKPLSIAQLVMLPYRSSRRLAAHYMDLDATNSSGSKNTAGLDSELSAVPPTATSFLPSRTAVSTSAANEQPPRKEPTIVLAIRMPQEMGICSWRWYEATIETLAVGVYLYATFVLTSTQFLSGNTGLAFVTIMALCSSAVRILENIFWSPR